CTLAVSAPVMFLGGIVLAVRQDVGLSWLFLVSLPALALSIGSVVRRMVPLFRRMQDRIDGANDVLREQITGIRVVRAFVREPEEDRKSTRLNSSHVKIS